MKKRVVITGLGAVTPLANNVRETWQGLLAGTSGIAPISAYDASELPVRFCGEIKNFTVEGVISAKEARKIDPFIQYALVAADEAVRDSGISIDDSNSERTGVIIGAGIGGLLGITEGYKTFLEKGARRVTPFYVPRSIINMAAGHVSMHFGIKGPSLATVTACTSGTHSIGQAARMIQYGDADIMVAGGTEMSSCNMGIAGFAAAKALSTNNDNPAGASRPWDKDRDGFVLADAAGVVVLEELEIAKARGANIYAEIIGFGMSSDAYHITMPPEDGDGAYRAMRNTIADAGISAEQVDYINAHGTSTPLGDRAEFIAVTRLLNGQTDTVKMSSTKSMTGHALGAAGAIEAIFTALAVKNDIAPPTINLDNPEPDFVGIDLIANTAKEFAIHYALSNSFGFGGTNGSLLLKKYND
ncbi:MAG: beta-ketoacyl-[acyl-carrier-protein] synthase II [Gammaproteobacteria bacterium]|nr:MAG: beta-ketoacyl-[acyl-carrier-protein] synthase II [Gammaproteobacteria bacterium]